MQFKILIELFTILGPAAPIDQQSVNELALEDAKEKYVVERGVQQKHQSLHSA